MANALAFVPAAVEAAIIAGFGAIIPQRNIGGIIPDVTVEENHWDESEITRHPVERGAQITDHSFDWPARLTVRAGFSNSSLQAGFNPNYVIDVYNRFLTLRASKQLMTVLTGKRAYQNMLFKSIRVLTDEKTETALMITAEMWEVIIVDTQTVLVQNANVAPAAASSVSTSQDQGQQQLTQPTNFNSNSLEGQSVESWAGAHASDPAP